MTLLQVLVLPEGFALPPLPYLVALAVGLGVVGLGVSRRDLAVDQHHVVALVPWILAGSGVHALYVVDALPTALRPLGGTPAVYATIAVLAGGVWLVADANAQNVPRVLALSGVAVFVPTYGSGIAVGLSRGTFAPFWSGVALVVSVLVAAAAWALLTRAVPRVEHTGWVGVVALFGHTVDGISTAVGIDVLGFGERTPLSRYIIEFAADLPTAAVVGSGWLFVLVKLTLVSGVLVLFADLMQEDPREGALLLGIVAAVGLGPGAHNLLLFAIAGVAA